MAKYRFFVSYRNRVGWATLSPAGEITLTECLPVEATPPRVLWCHQMQLCFSLSNCVSTICEVEKVNAEIESASGRLLLEAPLVDLKEMREGCSVTYLWTPAMQCVKPARVRIAFSNRAGRGPFSNWVLSTCLNDRPCEKKRSHPEAVLPHKKKLRPMCF